MIKANTWRNMWLDITILLLLFSDLTHCQLNPIQLYSALRKQEPFFSDLCMLHCMYYLSLSITSVYHLELTPHIVDNAIRYVLVQPNLTRTIGFTIYPGVYYRVTQKELLSHKATPVPWVRNSQLNWRRFDQYVSLFVTYLVTSK